MTLKSNEIVWWNTLVNSLLSLTASAMVFSSAITDKQLIGKRILYNIPIGTKYFNSEMIMHIFQLNTSIYDNYIPIKLILH